MSESPPEIHVVIDHYPETIIAECIEIPVITEGSTQDEVMKDVAEGIKGYFKAFPEQYKEIAEGNRKVMKIAA